VSRLSDAGTLLVVQEERMLCHQGTNPFSRMMSHWTANQQGDSRKINGWSKAFKCPNQQLRSDQVCSEGSDHQKVLVMADQDVADNTAPRCLHSWGMKVVDRSWGLLDQPHDYHRTGRTCHPLLKTPILSVKLTHSRVPYNKPCIFQLLDTARPCPSLDWQSSIPGHHRKR